MSVNTESWLQNHWPRFFPEPAVLLSIIVVLGAWQALSTTMPGYRFPGLERLAMGVWLVLTGGTQYDPVAHYGMTLLRIVIAFSIVMVFGTIVGVAMGVSSVLEDYLSTYTVVFLTVPSVVWTFLAVMWFGIRDLFVPVFVIVVIILPYVAVNMWSGTKAVDGSLPEMARAFHVTRWDIWRHIYLPHLTPYTYATARLAFAISWKLALVAEIFGSNIGVGVIVNNYYASFRTDLIIAWALPVMVLMLGIEQVFQQLEDRSYRWKPEADTETTTLEGEAV